MKANEIISRMEQLRNDEQREVLMRFFRTGPGEYGQGDEFLGIRVPQTRSLVKEVWRQVTPEEAVLLLQSAWHEVRLAGLLILVARFGSLASWRLADDFEAKRQRDKIVSLYLRHCHRANNWDLVDLSAPKLLGLWLLLPTTVGDKQQIMDELAQNPCLWRQRISIVSCWMPSRYRDYSWCLRYAEMLLGHPHDLIHKAVGWMLREMGKQGGMEQLRDFLRQHHGEMSRTTLRYAIEKMTAEERHYWMSL